MLILSKYVKIELNCWIPSWCQRIGEVMSEPVRSVTDGLGSKGFVHFL